MEEETEPDTGPAMVAPALFLAVAVKDWIDAGTAAALAIARLPERIVTVVNPELFALLFPPPQPEGSSSSSASSGV